MSATQSTGCPVTPVGSQSETGGAEVPVAPSSSPGRHNDAEASRDADLTAELEAALASNAYESLADSNDGEHLSVCELVCVCMDGSDGRFSYRRVRVSRCRVLPAPCLLLLPYSCVATGSHFAAAAAAGAARMDGSYPLLPLSELR
eukprot:GHVU01113748.1.p2 GENE.GHVU01113748.1~~GHVU01113748.1.p2  ORF type:complete len:146 (-),score=6.06 GHVU01113748.1:790-1227(-)